VRSDHPLAGHIVVFTGKLSALGRKDARTLVSRLGGTVADEVSAKTTVLVVGAEGGGSAGTADDEPVDASGKDKSAKLKRAEALNAQGAASIEVVGEDEFCRRAGVPTAAELRQQFHASRDLLARYRALREDHLRYLVQCGVIRPVLRTGTDTFFAFPDLAVIKDAHDQVARGASFRTIVKGLLAAREGQLSFDFRLEAEPARIIALGHRDRPAAAAHAVQPSTTVSPARANLAEELFRAASALDDGDESMAAEAAASYRKALELDPTLVAALINLANIHYSRDELVEAQALYEQAIRIDPEYFEAHFNLGNIHHDLGRFPEARASYLEALRLNPAYADAHFYLAVTCEKMGLSQDARPHWRAYRQLAPHGEWVELAAEFCD
jgi:tetratricopeptide (TPR) repeat protein